MSSLTEELRRSDDYPNTIEETLYKPLPDNVNVEADRSTTSHPPGLATDKLIETYWYSGAVTGNFKIIFSPGEWVSLLRLRTGFGIVPTVATFEVFAKERLSDGQLISVGKVVTQITSNDPFHPQPVDIDIVWGQYEMLLIKCNGVPVINDIEIFGG
ncbi:hypothetical protein [Paenibacillus sp. SER-28]